MIDEMPAWTPDRSLHFIALRYIHSCEGPQHIELLEGPRGWVWDGSSHPGIQHVGLWTNDLVASCGRPSPLARNAQAEADLMLQYRAQAEPGARKRAAS